MATHPCATCGRQINPSVRCPYCGTENPLDEELARIERSIAEMSARDMALLKERSQLSSKMQAALFQRDILAHANAQRLKRSSKPSRVRRRRLPNTGPGSRPPWTPPESGDTLLDDPPREEPPPPRRPPPGPRPDATRPGPPDPEPDTVQPEASSRSVQNILLALAALLLGVAAVVFAAVAMGSLGAAVRAAVLAVAAAVALAIAPGVARRGLTSTGDTIASVGLVFVPLAGYALHDIRILGADTVSDQVFLGLTFAMTAAVSYGYAGTSRLSAPRYATVVALQPVLPLLAYPRIGGPAGWALVLSAVAVMDLLLVVTVARRGRLVPRWPQGRPRLDDAPGVPPVDEPERPESAPEEPDLVLDLGQPQPARRRRLRLFPGPRPAGTVPPGTPVPPGPVPPSATWLRELLLVLVAAAVVGGLAYAVAALLSAADPGAALRGAAVLLLAATTGVAGAALSRSNTADQVAGAVLTLSVIGAAARLGDVAIPDRALLLTAAVVALTGAVVRSLPERVRRGPQLASSAALAVIGLVVAVDVLRAAVAPVSAARPVWDADLAAYPGRIAEAAGTAGWQLAVAALLLTIAAALALPAGIRHEAAVAGVALTALAVPASFQLPWSQAPWPLVVATAALGLTGLFARSHRAAVAHIVAAGVVGLFAAAESVAQPWLTGAVLTALAGAGLMIALWARQLPTYLYAWLVGDWAAGGAAFALPGAVAAGGLASADPTGGDPAATVPVLAASFVAVALTLTVAAITQVARREISLPLTLGTGLGALAVALAAFRADRSGPPDVWVGALLLTAALMLFLARSIDAGRRADRVLDGPDIAAAAATVAVIGASARVMALAFDHGELAATAAVVLLVALAVRAMPLDWRRGPVLGTAVGGAVIALIAGYTALSGGLRALAAPGAIWQADLSGWPGDAPPGAWQAPVALVLLALAATAVLPRPAGYDVAALCVGLATVGTPAALGLPWWSPLLVGGAVMTGYGVASVAARDPRAAVARAAVAGGVGLHAVGASLVRPWTTAAMLALVALVGVVVAVLARLVAPAVRAEAELVDLPEQPARPVTLPVDDTGLPRHLGQIGGAATAAALLAVPGIFAALTAESGQPADVVLTAALAASSITLALVTLLGAQITQYLPYATVGLVGGATVTAVVSLPTDHPTALYAAAAALLGIVAELLRGATTAPGVALPPPPRWSAGVPGSRGFTVRRPTRLRGRWAVNPATGAVAVAVLPTALALASIAPALVAALVHPYQTLGQIWQGAPESLRNPAPGGEVDGTSVLAALLLTTAAALAAIGFNGGRPGRAVPVVLPGLAVTLLITPIALAQPWPAATMAALTVFTIAMLGLALTPPPLPGRASLLSATRAVVFGIGLAAGGAGLAGSLAEQNLTLFTLGSAVGVGVTAGLAGRSQTARIMGWLFASTFGQLFALTAGLAAGLAPSWSAFGVLAVGAGLLIVEATLPRLRLPEAGHEASAVEWSGYAAALLAVALAYNSPQHVAALMAAWGAVLGLAAIRPGRRSVERRVLFWLAVAFEVGAWWMLMRLSDVALPEAYTLPFAAMALLVGVLESRHRPELSSWAAYGPALLAAFGPTTMIVLSTDASGARQVLLLLGAVATLIAGARWRQQAPVLVGAVTTAVTALHFTVTLVGPWLVLIPVGVVLLALGAGNENRRRTQERVRGALVGMR